MQVVSGPLGREKIHFEAPPAERDDYYNMLEQTQKGDGDITGWLLWFLGSTERAIGDSETLVAGVPVKAEFCLQPGQGPQYQLPSRRYEPMNKPDYL